MTITDPDFLGGEFYKGDTVYWNDRNSRGDNPWCSGQIIAIDDEYAWVKSFRVPETVRLDWLSVSKPENWGSA